MILSVGWPLSRQLVLSFEAILECTAPFIENRRQYADYTAHKNKLGTTRAGETKVTRLGQPSSFALDLGMFSEKTRSHVAPGKPAHILRVPLSTDAGWGAGESLPQRGPQEENKETPPRLSGAAETLSVQTLPPSGNQAPHHPLPGLPPLAQRPLLVILVTWTSRGTRALGGRLRRHVLGAHTYHLVCSFVHLLNQSTNTYGSDTTSRQQLRSCLRDASRGTWGETDRKTDSGPKVKFRETPK